jgi:hypothetical protein
MFIYDLFNYFISSSDYTAQNYMIIHAELEKIKSEWVTGFSWESVSGRSHKHWIPQACFPTAILKQSSTTTYLLSGTRLGKCNPQCRSTHKHSFSNSEWLIQDNVSCYVFFARSAWNKRMWGLSCLSVRMIQLENRWADLVANPGEVKAFFFHVAATLFYIIQRTAVLMFCILRKSVIIYHRMALLKVALVSIPPDRFVWPPCWYYRRQEIEKNDFRVVPSGITPIRNFIQIRPAFLELNHAGGRTDTTALYAFISSTHNKQSFPLK